MADPHRRKHEPKHVRLYASITGSAAWKHTTGNSVKVLLALCARDNGTRNGAISFSVREAAEAVDVSIPTANRCLAELQEKGFIRCTQKGAFSRKVSHASLWRYTWAAWPGGSPAAPTRDFEQWQPNGNTRCRKFPVTEQVSSREVETGNAPIQQNYTEGVETPHVSVGGPDKESCTHTVYQGLGLGTPETQQRKQAALSIEAQLAELRDRLIEHRRRHEPGEQTRLAKTVQIPPGTLSKFISGRSLPMKYREPLTAALS